MKNISKSIRLSQKTFDYINSFDGDGFNQKFENIILYAMEEEKNLQKRVIELEKLIDSKNNELNILNHNLSFARSQTSRFVTILKQLESFI